MVPLIWQLYISYFFSFVCFLFNLLSKTSNPQLFFYCPMGIKVYFFI